MRSSASAIVLALGVVFALVCGASCVMPDYQFLDDLADGGVRPSHCSDQARNEGETDVDCGGGCRPCADGLLCAADMDCTSLVCREGRCAIPTCTDAVKNGAETDVDCGGGGDCAKCLTGQSCKGPEDCASGACSAGTCAVVCLEGKGDCDGDMSNGCETNLKTTAEHCGACGVPCSLPHATARCSGGACVVDTCQLPFEDCDGDPKNGCETNASSDEKNCAGCGRVCPWVNGVPFCTGSACQITCADGFADCAGDRGNGCETNTTKDVTNCGGCGKVCDGKNGTPWCKDSQCGISNCPAGLGDCNGDPSDGCEVNLTQDAGNCKTCGTACVAANGNAACVASACKIDSCNAGHADCDSATPGGYTNGCETNTDSDLGNCGKCGQACSIANGSAKCDVGACKVKTCAAPFADCDGNGLDCETDTSSNKLNCGGCGASGVSCGLLNASATGCAASNCTPSCVDGWGACGNAAIGCDTSLDTAEHCGNCQTSCVGGGTPFCVGRVCRAHLDIVVVNASTNGSGTTSMTLHHALATPAGNHRLVLLGVASLGNSAAQAAPTSVLYGVAAMQLAHQTWSQNQAWAGIYYMDDATLPAAPPGPGVDVVVIGAASQMQGHLIELRNVEQAIPFMAITRPLDGDTGSYNNCSSAHPDDVLTLSIDGSYLFGAAGYFATGVSTTTPVYPLETKSTATPDPFNAQLGIIAGYRGPLAVGAQHLGWNMSGCNKYGQALVGIRPVVTP